MKLVCGVGINNADYPVHPKIDGVRLMCPFYRVWSSMIKRCYSDKVIKRQPTYSGCNVCEEWLTFSNFKAWMEQQYWEGIHLDKDILGKDSKIYSPSNCAFVSNTVNKFVTDRKNFRGKLPIGVHVNEIGRFRAMCSDGEGNQVHLGYFSTAEDAHKAWKEYKLSIAKELAEKELDTRVKLELVKRYEGDFRETI